MKNVFLVVLFFTSFISLQAQHAVEAGSDQVSVCESPVVLRASTYKGWAQMPAYGIQPVFPLMSIKFINDSIGFAGSLGIIYKTTDKGVSWNAVYTAATTYFYDFWFINKNTGFAVGSTGTLLRTTNGGVNWTAITMDGTTAFTAICFSSDKIGYTVGNYGAIFKTIDGGLTWKKNVFNASHNYHSVVFTSELNGFIAGAGGILLRTTDGGINWMQKNIGLNNPTLYSLNFTSPETGFVCGNGGNILKTTDGGDSWERYSSDSIFMESSPTFGGKQFSKYILRSVCFVSADTGYIAGYVGNNSIFAKTTDGGKSWLEQASRVNTKINRMTMVGKPAIGFAVAGAGTIISFQEKPAPLFVSNSSWTSNYEQFSSQDTALVAPASTTTYKFRAYNEYAMEISDSVTVYVEPLKLTSATKYVYAMGSPVRMDNFKTNYTGPEKFSYKWKPATGLSSSTEQFPMVTMSSPSVQYNVTVTTSKGCSETCTVTLKDSLTAIASVDRSPVCSGTVQLNTRSNYSGTAKLKYKWIPSAGLSNDTIANPTAYITENTNYTVTITTESGATASGTVLAKISPFAIDAGIDRSLRCGSAITLATSTNYNSSKPIHYKWTPATGLDNDTIYNPKASPGVTTTYKVTATSFEGCVATDEVTITITPFTVNAGADKIIQCGVAIKLDSVTANLSSTTPVRYKWEPATGLSNDTIANPLASPLTTTTYTVTVSSMNGCSYSDKVLVTVSPLSIELGSNKAITCGNAAQLGITTTNYSGAGLKYKWTPASGLNNDTLASPIATPSATTKYSLMVTTPNGCTATDDITVSVSAAQKPAISFVGVSDDNKNIINWNAPESIQVNSYNIYKETNVTDAYLKIGTVQANATLSFVDTSSNPDIQSNKYKISLLDGCGFESEMSSHHKTMHLSINKGVGTIWNLIWEAYIGFPVSTYNIYRGTTKQNIQIIGSLSGSNTQFSDYTAPAGEVYYQIEALSASASNIISKQTILKNSFNQQAKISSRSNIATNKGGVDGLNSIRYNQLAVYPNPATGTITIEVNSAISSDRYLHIYNSIGQLVTSKKLHTNKQTVDISDLEKGIYYVDLNGSKVTGRSCLIVK